MPPREVMVTCCGTGSLSVGLPAEIFEQQYSNPLLLPPPPPHKPSPAWLLVLVVALPHVRVEQRVGMRSPRRMACCD